MKTHVVAALLGGILFAPALLRAAEITKPVAPEAVDVGGTITVFGTGLVADASAVLFDAAGKRAASLEVPSVDTAGTTLTFHLPSSVGPGRYYIRITVADLQDALVPGDVRVQRPDVKIESISPTTAYRDGLGGFSFVLIGQSFAPVRSQDAPATPISDTVVEVEGEGDIGAFPMLSATPPATASEEERACAAVQPTVSTRSVAFRPCVWVKDFGHQVQVRGYRPKGNYQGPVNVRVRVGRTEPAAVSNWTKLVLARTSTVTVLLAALALFALVGFVVNWVIATSRKPTMIHGRWYGPWQAFLIDSQSNTYSLSKFQLFAFSFAFIFSYLYVMLCEWLVQWRFVLPDIPPNLAAMLGISGGATLAAAAVTNTKGTKGAGDIYPSLSDLITTGGQVVPERFQFLIWTLIVCAGFVALLLARDPASIDGFPTIPDGVLYVMGISAAAYVGGKVTRQAGPVIRNLALAKDAMNNRVVIIQGENLSTAADFFVDEEKLPLVTDDEKSHAGLRDKTLVEQAKAQPNASDSTFSSELKVTIVSGKAKVLDKAGPHTFKIVNRDGQFADEPFPRPTITGAVAKAGGPALAPNAKNVVLTVTGTALFEPIAAKWTPAAPMMPAPGVTVASVSDTQLEATVSDVGAAGSASLTISALGGEGSTIVKV